MKKIICGILLLIHGVSFAGVQEVFNKLIKANHLRNRPIVVRSNVTSWCSLACSDGNRIVVSNELLALVKNDDELAGVIGHELAHDIYKGELEADLLGLKYAAKAGYDYCKAAQMLKPLKKDKQHPNGSDRYKNTGCGR